MNVVCVVCGSNISSSSDNMIVVEELETTILIVCKKCLSELSELREGEDEDEEREERIE